MTQPSVRLTGLGTAVPEHVLDQPAVRDRAMSLFGAARTDMTRLRSVFDNAGVSRRHTCLPLDAYGVDRGWAARNALYLTHAVDLVERTARSVLDDSGLAPGDIDAVVTVSTTGVATPSLDAYLLNRLGLRRDIVRLPIFGLGCCGGVTGLSRAAEVARAIPGRRVLFLTVELCTLTFRPADTGKSNVIAAALFADGAAGAVVSTHRDDGGPELRDWGEHTWPDTLDIMGWNVADDGLGVLFARAIPGLVRERFADVAHGFLERNGLAAQDLVGHACHPGGAKVVEALEEALDLPFGGLSQSRAVLRDYGNMSAPSVLFVLERLRDRARSGPVLATALGPGFTAGFILFGPASTR